MAKSLQEQLMGAGLVDQKKAKAIKQEQRKKKKQQPKGQVQTDEAKARIEAERQAKAEKDRALNAERKAEAEAKAVAAQIKQLIDSNRIVPEQDDIGYQFVDGTKVRKMFVSEKLQSQLAKGLVSIVRQGESYVLVPNKVAEKIAQRDEEVVIPLKHDEPEIGEDDPYADYKIPDDLMW